MYGKRMAHIRSTLGSEDPRLLPINIGDAADAVNAALLVPCCFDQLIIEAGRLLTASRLGRTTGTVPPGSAATGLLVKVLMSRS